MHTLALPYHFCFPSNGGFPSFVRLLRAWMGCIPFQTVGTDQDIGLDIGHC